MRTADCTSRADECRRLAKLAAQPEDWQHFIEMAANQALFVRLGFDCRLQCLDGFVHWLG